MIAAFGLALALLNADSIAGDYNVRIVTSPGLRAEVVARIPSGDTIQMGTGAIDHIARGWASFVHDFAATDSRGRKLAVRELQDSGKAPGWIVARHSGAMTIRYSVDLSFTQKPWPPGNEQAGLWADSALFIVTKALFATPARPGQWLVTFDIPQSWKTSAPWPALSSRKFSAPSRESLVYNTVVMGKHGEYKFSSDGFDISLALLGNAAAAAPLLRSTFEPVMQEYLRIFDATPRGQYLMTVFYGDEEDGEGFENSAAFRTKVPLVAETRLVWGNHIAHELLHMWLGKQLHGAVAAESEWFNEGVTEYISNRTLLRAGLIDRNQFLEKVKTNIALYSYFNQSGIFDTVTVRQSGQRKYRYRFGVYNGGWATAFSIDQEVATRSSGSRGIEDVLRLLYDRRAKANQAWTWDDLLSASSDIAGSDMKPWFDSHVAGLEPLPLERYFKRLGFLLMGQPYAAEMYLIPDPSATDEQRRRGEMYLSSRPK